MLGRRLEGVPRDDEDFIPVDEHGRVKGLAHVYAAGDGADFPFKHGGLAAQQADAAAEAMLEDLGLPIVAHPFEPVIQGVLFTQAELAYVEAALSGGAPGTAERPASLLWSPPAKIVGRHLSPYLVERTGAPLTPEQLPGAKLVAVSVDARRLVRSVRGVLDGDPVPPG